MRAHQITGQDDGVACIVCGAYYLDPDEVPADCTGRTDLVHGNDDVSTSHHALDGCADYDEGGQCQHLAVLLDCTCDLCR